MTTVPLSSVVNGSFIKGFQNAASSGSKSSNPLQQSSAVSLSSSLRYGAQLYGNTIQNLNSLIGFVNIADGTLDKLFDLTDKMIVITENASRRGIGAETRLNLEGQFRRLANQFIKTVTDSSSQSRDPLSIEDLNEVFTLIGLDQEQSDSITKLFKNFITASTDTDQLASDEYLARRPISVPADLSTEYKKRGSAAFAFSDSTNYPNDPADPAPFQITTGDFNEDGTNDLVASFFGGASRTDKLSVYLSNGDGSYQAEIQSDAGPANQYAALTTLDIDNDSHLDVVSISDSSVNIWVGDGAGNLSSYFGSSGVPNIYSNYALESAELAGAGTTEDVVYAYYDSNQIVTATGESLFATEITSTILTAGNFIRDFELIDFNQDTKLDIVGAYGGTSYGFFVSLGNGDGTFQTAVMTGTPTPASDRVDFIATGDLNGDYKPDIIGQGVGGVNTYMALNNGTSFNTVSTITSTSAYPAVAITDINNDKKNDIIYNSNTTSGLNSYGIGYRLGNGDGTFGSEVAVPTTTGSYASIGNVSNILITDADGNNTNDIITTTYEDPGLSSDVFLNPTTTQKIRSPIPSDNYSSIFDSERTLSSRVEAYRLTTDLKSLRDQIIGNKENLESARELISKNMVLVRATGLALLDLSEQIDDSTTAEEIAELVRSRIRSQASAALSQAENLTPLTVATLALESSSDS